LPADLVGHSLRESDPKEDAMSQPTPAPEVHHHEDAIDHFEEEFKNLEGVTRFGRPIRIGALVLLLAGIVAAGVWWVTSPPPVTSSRKAYVTTTGSPIEIEEPKGRTLDDPPVRFAWESVSGRLQYVVRVYVKGTSTPVVERMLTTSSLELTTSEQQRLPRGKTFIWTVVAQGKDGSTIGSGQATFKVR
jgi:hypothetical protein